VARLRIKLENLAEPLVNLSIGMATGEEGCHLPDLMRLADDRTYQDKAAHKKMQI